MMPGRQREVLLLLVVVSSAILVITRLQALAPRAFLPVLLALAVPAVLGLWVASMVWRHRIRRAKRAERAVDERRARVEAVADLLITRCPPEDGAEREVLAEQLRALAASRGVEVSLDEARTAISDRLRSRGFRA